jgi:hypothetical protein
MELGLKRIGRLSEIANLKVPRLRYNQKWPKPPIRREADLTRDAHNGVPFYLSILQFWHKKEKMPRQRELGGHEVLQHGDTGEKLRRNYCRQAACFNGS